MVKSVIARSVVCCLFPTTRVFLLEINFTEVITANESDKLPALSLCDAHVFAVCVASYILCLIYHMEFTTLFTW